MKNPNSTRKSMLVKEKTFLIFVVLMVLFPFAFGILSGGGLSAGPTRFWQGQLINFFIMAVLAMSYDLLMGYGGILSFGHAASFGAGAYTVALLVTHVMPKFTASYRIMLGSINLTDILALIFVFLMAFIVSVLIGLLFSATSIRLKGAYFAMLTMALSGALHILSKATDFSKWTGADEGIHGLPVPLWLNPTQNRLTFYFISLAFLVLCYFLMRRMVNSPVGRIIQATRENEDRVRMIGYNPVTYRTLTFVIASVFAGIAGGLYALWTSSVTPSMTSITLTVNALIMTILGGMGTLVGPIIGAGIMQVFSQFFYTWFGARWPLVFGLIFILIVMFLPYGIVGTWILRKNNLKQGWQRFMDMLKPKAE